LGPLKTQALVFENSKKEIKIITLLQKLIHCGLIHVLIIYLTAKASINKKILKSQRRATLNIHILQLGHKIVLHTAQKLGID
jgi:branched-subunit amino acid transport protein AzlD